jgi:hypothetical protein
MEKDLQWVCDALALAGCILEQKNREDWCCPFHHQGEPRKWSKPECQTCEYSFALQPGLKMAPIISYEPEFRASCWVEYLLWEANREETSLEGTQ